MKFVITADDYGVSPIIDQAIESAIENKCISAVAGFANGLDGAGNFSVQKLRTLKDNHPDVSVGLHFTITSGRPVSENPKSLINKSGRFRSIVGHTPFKIDPLDLERELNAQIGVFKQAGLEIEHFSDHNGILTLVPNAAYVYANVVADYMKGIKKTVPVRSPIPLSLLNKPPMHRSVMTRKGKRALIIRNFLSWYDIDFGLDVCRQTLAHFQSKPSFCTDYLVEHFYGSPSRKTLVNIFKHTPKVPYDLVRSRFCEDPTAEIMVHLAVDSTMPDHQTHLKALKRHRGISVRYVKNKRVLEHQILSRELPGMRKSFVMVNFSGKVLP